MCGIAGSIHYPFSEETIFKKMSHRGPDEQGSFHWNEVQFYHLRLSILDIASGKQPMHLGEKFSIIFNGEIFNHLELRKKYNLAGKTSSDTETLLLLYEKLGTAMLNELDGMFAFAILDKPGNKIFIARDRAGEKPLYYFSDHEKFVFTSELNALKSILPLEIEGDYFHSYLRFGSFFKAQTPYKNVEELVAGSYLMVDISSLRLQTVRWWNILPFYSRPQSETLESALKNTDQILHQSVKRRLESSDIEVGAFLSGGIDSGLVTAVASQYNPKIKTFTVSFKDEYDEAPLARLVADKYNTQHHEIKIDFAHLREDIEQLLGNYGEPFFDSSAIPSYYVSKAARQYVTVILNGDGADELFGGYRRYVPFAKFDFFNNNILFKSVSGTLLKLLPAGNHKKSNYNYLYRLMALSSQKGLNTYLSAGVDIFEGYTGHFVNTPHNYLSEAEHYFQTINSTNLSGLKKLMNLDFDINLFGDLLVKMDIATMANSQEGRSPFLCKEFLEYIPGLPDRLKINGKTTKFLLRKLAEKYLPKELINQPKRGFEIPLKNWIDNELKEIILSYLNTSDNLYSEFIDVNFVSSLIKKEINISDEKRAKILWTIFSMEVWYKKIFKQ